MPQNDDLIKSIQELLEKERGEARKMVREEVEVERKEKKMHELADRMAIKLSLGKIEDKLKDQTIAITRLEKGQEKIETRMENLEEGQGRLEKRIDTSEANIVKEIKDLSETLGEVMSKAVTHSEFEERLKPIEDALDIPHAS